MNIHHLELFYFVAKHGGIAAAVRNIPYGIQQPAVSGQIAKLEESLGTKLFQRRLFALSPGAWNCSSSSNRSLTTSRSSVRSSVRTGRHSCALPRPRSCCTTTSPSCCKSFGRNFLSFAFIYTKPRAPKPRDYSWPETSILRLPSLRKNRALGFRFDRYSSCR
jgi:hypothetical protein